MSRQAITKYLNDLDILKTASGTVREGVVSEAFKDLLKAYARAQNLIFLNQYELPRQDGARRIVDGALVYDVRLAFGYWEAKDEEDDLDAEIAAKFRRGYPRDNIIFEDSRSAVLIQNGNEVTRCPVQDVDALGHLLDLFFAYERPEITQFRKAVAQFQSDLPAVLKALRAMIETEQAGNKSFARAATRFLKHAQETINPSVSAEDVREMLIQHILTEEIFAKVFDEDDFHRENNVAKQLYALENLFFKGAVKKNTLKGLEPYYNAIRATAHQIKSHSEKQAFLKVIYEGFYRVYNPKAADRLGVIYTPNEIVRFMVESADWLCERHFKKSLVDPGVEILDPAAGTGTFICELLERFRGRRDRLAHKYKEEMHANEVAILPYYVANLNIEATYAQIMGQYAEFPNLCFVDTLDNVQGLGNATNMVKAGHYGDLIGGLSEVNIDRIKQQNKRKISVVIGNPPYRANQEDENDNNKNRKYDHIDERIQDTYIKQSTAQKTKAYDMYTRFFRWASDRLHEEGILAFVTNRSFIDSRTMDGFRKCMADDFNEIWIVDLKGNARTSGERRRQEGGNVFSDKIRVGVAVYFCVKKKSQKGCRIFYQAVRDYAKADEKLEFIASPPIFEREFEEVRPSSEGDWIDQTDNNLSTLVPLASKKVKNLSRSKDAEAIFKIFSLGLKSNRDEWVCDFSKVAVTHRVSFMIDFYESERSRIIPLIQDWKKKNKFNKLSDEQISRWLTTDIKWTRKLKRLLGSDRKLTFKSDRLILSDYRPFTRQWAYFDAALNEDHYQLGKVFQGSSSNPCFVISGQPGAKPFHCLATAGLFHHDTLEKTTSMSRFIFEKDGARIDNITDWALKQFTSRYKPTRNRPITKDAIFHYVYGVLHDPLYREKYAQNLKREFPRIPFHEDFWLWADWGEKLMALHIHYELVEPWPLQRADVRDDKAAKAGQSPRPILKSDPDAGIIVLDSETQLGEVPKAAFAYRLGNRSALDWILDQHKEKTPKDPTIREKFNTYRFADHKERVIDLLARVTRVSVETMEIVEAMREEGSRQ